MRTDTSQIALTINRAKVDKNLHDALECLRVLSEKYKYYSEQPLDENNEAKAKWILKQRDFFADAIQSVCALINYAHSLNQDIKRKEDCISELYSHAEALQSELEIVTACWRDATDTITGAGENRLEFHSTHKLQFTTKPAA